MSEESKHTADTSVVELVRELREALVETVDWAGTVNGYTNARQYAFPFVAKADAFLASAPEAKDERPITEDGRPIFGDGSAWDIRSYLLGIEQAKPELSEDERIRVEEITMSKLQSFLKINNTRVRQTAEGQASVNFAIDNLKQLVPDQAFELENYVNQLIYAVTSNSKNMNSDNLQEAARAALRILPETSREPKLAKSAISAMARTIVFLAPPERLRAVKTILEISLSDGIALETKERLASVGLAVAPTLDQAGLEQIIRDLRPKLRSNEKISPSLAQIISLATSRI